MLAEIKGTPLDELPWGRFSYDTVLHQHEEACILLERDSAGRLYLAWWSDADQDTERFVCLPLTKARLQAILSDEISPLSAMENPEDGYLLAVDIDLETDKPVRIIKTTAAALPQDAMPHPEATLNIPMPATV
ncbi:MAG: hypothetical protein OXE87_03500 [Chloroflexi bacterium]|nr:hypothetical protein [Chloroflexota bacterium]